MNMRERLRCVARGRHVLVLLILVFMAACARPLPTRVEQVHFRDPAFRRCVEKSGVADLAAIRELTCNDDKLKDVAELKYLTGLSKLELNMNNLSSVDLRQNLALQELNLYGYRKKTDIQLAALPQLRDLLIDTPRLFELFSRIDLAQMFPRLNYLYLGEQGRKEALDPNLGELHLSHPLLDTLIIKGNSERKSSSTSGVLLNFNLPQLTQFGIDDIPLTALQLNTMPQLKAFAINRTNLKLLELSHLPRLEQCIIDDSLLADVVLENLPRLRNLSVSGNRLTVLDLTAVPELEQILADNNQLHTVLWPEDSQLNIVSLKSNQLTKLDLYSLEHIGSYDLTDNPLPQIADIDFDEPQFKERLLDLGYRYTTEVLEISEMAGSREYLATSKDLSRFNNLVTLYLNIAEGQQALDLSALKGLRWLAIGRHRSSLPGLILPKSRYLEEVRLSQLGLETIEIPDLPRLKILDLYDNKLTKIGLPELPAIEQLILNYNPLTGSLRLEDLPHLTFLGVRGSLIESLYVDNMPELRELLADDCPLKEYYVAHAPRLHTFYVDCEALDPKKHKACH